MRIQQEEAAGTTPLVCVPVCVRVYNVVFVTDDHGAGTRFEIPERLWNIQPHVPGWMDTAET